MKEAHNRRKNNRSSQKLTHSFSLQPRYYSNSNDNSHCRSVGRFENLGSNLYFNNLKVHRILLKMVLLLSRPKLKRGGGKKCFHAPLILPALHFETSAARGLSIVICRCVNAFSFNYLATPYVMCTYRKDLKCNLFSLSKVNFDFDIYHMFDCLNTEYCSRSSASVF